MPWQSDRKAVTLQLHLSGSHAHLRSLGMTHLRSGVQGAMVASERFPSGSAPLPSLLGPAKSRMLGRDGMSGRFPPSSAPFPSLRGIADAVAIRSENRDLAPHSEANLRAAETSYTSSILKTPHFPVRGLFVQPKKKRRAKENSEEFNNQ